MDSPFVRTYGKYVVMKSSPLSLTLGDEIGTPGDGIGTPLYLANESVILTQAPEEASRVIGLRWDWEGQLVTIDVDLPATITVSEFSFIEQHILLDNIVPKKLG